MLDFEETQLNETFLEMLQDDEMKKEAQARAAEYLKAQIYEDSFMSRVVPPTPISPEECDRDVNSPNYQVVIDKEFTDVRAVTTTMRGMDDYQYVEGDRYAVKFYKIDSEEYEITEGELRGYRQPIQKLIRHHVAFQIRKKMDEQFLGLCEQAVRDENGQLKTPGNGYTGSDQQVINKTGSGEEIITPELLTKLKNLLDARSPEYLDATTLLMTKSMYNFVSTWIQEHTTSGANTGPGLAGGITQEFWKDGYEYDRLMDCRVVKTRKNDVLNHNEIFVFPEPDYIGHHFTFNDDRFAIEKKWDQMKWKGWRSFGFAIGNEYSVGKLILDT
ncbi:MAG: hypothetical protein ABEN55_10935 [Bradymonadaceae bacterium]